MLCVVRQLKSTISIFFFFFFNLGLADKGEQRATKISRNSDFHALQSTANQISCTGYFQTQDYQDGFDASKPVHNSRIAREQKLDRPQWRQRKQLRFLARQRRPIRFHAIAIYTTTNLYYGRPRKETKKKQSDSANQIQLRNSALDSAKGNPNRPRTCQFSPHT